VRTLRLLHSFLVGGATTATATSETHHLAGFKLGLTELPGPEEGQFTVPCGVEADDEHIYIVDHMHRLQKLNKGGGTLVEVFGTKGSGENQFQNPCGMTRQDDTLFIADFFNKGIVKIGTKDGAWKGTIGLEEMTPSDVTLDLSDPYFYRARAKV
jgi:hypothetical protein